MVHRKWNCTICGHIMAINSPRYDHFWTFLFTADEHPSQSMSNGVCSHNNPEQNSTYHEFSPDNHCIVIENNNLNNNKCFTLNEKNSSQDIVKVSGKEAGENSNTSTKAITGDLLTINNVESATNITIREKSFDDVFNEILLWPEKQIIKRKRKAVEHLPAVITSDKWIEIMLAKKKEDKEEERNIKKEKRIVKIEENKKIKAIKLEERNKKKTEKAKPVPTKRKSKMNIGS